MKENVLVMIPGPTPVVGSIREQMAREVQAFGDPRFVKDYKELIEDLGKLFNCSGKTFPLAGTGTLAMEMSIANVTKKGDNVLVVTNGFFGDRFIEICERKGLNVDVLSAEWGKCVSVSEIDAKLKQKKYAAVTISHVDTSTGVVAPIAEIGKLFKNLPETVFIVDGVAATGAEFADVDGMGIDIMFTGSQKAFGVSPGMFILWAGQKALKIRDSLGVIPEYYVDFHKWIPTMDEPIKYFATPAVNLVWALKEATKLIADEGVAARYERHKKNAAAVHKALEAIGLKILAEPDCRATTLCNVMYPEGVVDMEFRTAMIAENVIVAGGLGAYMGKAFRIGHMGNITKEDMTQMLSAIEAALQKCGVNINPGTAAEVYLNAMS